MKWIGQLIYDQIAKFRKDVYLENISTGTIASGGNLGLDSNNKIVKAAEVGSSVDLTSEVTGTLPVGNGGTGVTSITDLKNLLDDETWTFANNITGTLATASQPNITSLGTLTVLGVDSVRLNDKSIEITGDTDDTFNITTGAAGATTLTTVDTAGTDGHFEIAADGDITLDSAGQIKLEPVAGNNILLDGTVTIDGGSVTGISTLGFDSVNLDRIHTSSESFADNDTSIMTSAAIDDKINTKYAYTYITFSASAVPTNSGSDPEWMFPNPTKGIYEEDWNSDSGITSTTLENSTAVGKNHAVNSIPLPHAGVLVGFHAIGRNDDSNLSFKAGLFHSSGAGTGDGIDWGSSGVNHEFTLECIATADTSGGVSGSSSFKGPCKLVSNTVNKTIAAGDTILPAIMATADNATDEIFVTWTIILKIPLTT